MDLTGVWSFMQSAAGLRIVADCTLLGAAGGIYVVPLFAQIQLGAERTRLSRTIGGMNILNALFMVLAALVAMVLLQAGLTVPQIFLFTALLNLLLLGVLCWSYPAYPRALMSRLRGLASRRLPEH
jgi:hypothetical protein